MSRGGSTRAWRELRAQVAEQLVYAGSLPCPRCGEPVRPGEPWHLGHRVSPLLGGIDTLSNVAPEHPRCNIAAGMRPVGVERSREW